MLLPRSLMTERLQLCIPGPAEAPAILTYFERNRGHLTPWDPPRPAGFYTLAFWRGRIDQNLEAAQRGTAGRYFLIRRDRDPGSQNRVIGTCNFSNIVDAAFQACHLGYGLDEQAVGHGFMLETLSALMPAVMQKRRLHRVMANYIPSNTRSARLLERLGFEIEGRAPKYLFIDGKWQDHVLTAFVRDSPGLVE